MSKTKTLSATLRANGGKGAARAERRAGRVPAVIYGDKQAPVTISLDFKAINMAIYAGHFLSTVHEIDVDGKKHRVLPRDYQLDPVKGFPLHVDFLRLGKGATITVDIPVHVIGADVAPGVKAGGTVNIIEHSLTVRCPADAIPAAIEIDISQLAMGQTIHLADVKLPKDVIAMPKGDDSMVSIVPPTVDIEADEAEAAAAVAATPTSPAAAPKK